MDSPATSPDLRFLDLNGNQIEAPVEWTPALMEVVVGPEHWSNTELHVQASTIPLMLRRLGGRIRILADWPRSGAGRYAVNVRTPEGDAGLLVTVRPAKLSEAAFTSMLDDLQHSLPAAVAIGLQRLGGLSGLTILPPAESTVAQELARLRRAVLGTESRPGLIQVLHGIAPDPHRMLRAEPLWVPRERVRRPHPADLVQSIARPHLLADDRLPTRVIDRRAEQSVDLYENRMILLFTNEVRRRLRRLEQHLATRSSTTANDHLRQSVTAMNLGLLRARGVADFLDDVTPVNYLPSRVSMVLLNRPLYRAALQGYLELHRSMAIRLEDDRLDAPLENVPWLYQLWGTMELLVQLLSVAAEYGYRVVRQDLVHRDAISGFVSLVPAGKPVLWLEHPGSKTDVRLVPEFTFNRTSVPRSQSFDQRPDITVEVRHRNVPPRLYVFDPKYKLAQEVDQPLPSGGNPNKVDIDKMHAYRDAIRDENGRRAVVSAATMYPGPSARYGPGVEAIQANPDQIDELRIRVSEILREALRLPDTHEAIPGGS